MNKNILAIETSTTISSVALSIEGKYYELSDQSNDKATVSILPMIDQLLKQHQVQLADLDALAYGKGPGSFTGVRLAASVTQAMAYATHLPVIGISTLQTVAQHSYEQYGYDRVMVVLDARRGEVYWGIFELGQDNLMWPHVNDQMTAPEQVRFQQTSEQTWYGVGNGWTAYCDELSRQCQVQPNHIQSEVYPSAKAMLSLAEHFYGGKEMVEAKDALPVYLRKAVG